MPTTDERVSRFRRRTGALAVIGFPLVLAASDLAAPSFEHGKALVVAVAAHPARTWALAGLRLAAALLFIAAIAAVVSVARDRGSRVAHFAAVLGVLGALGQAQDSAYQLFVLNLRNENPAQAGALLSALDTLAGPLELPLLLAFALSLLLIGAAAWRSGTASVWAFVAAIGAFLAHFAPGPIGSIVADVLLVVAFILIGLGLLGKVATAAASADGLPRRIEAAGSRA